MKLSQIPVLNIGITIWKELIIIIIGLLCLPNLYKLFKKNTLYTIRYTLYLITTFLLLAIMSYFINPPPSGLQQWIWGFRYDYFFLITFVIFSLSQLNKKYIQSLNKIAIYSCSTAIILGLVIFFIKPENLTFLGFRNDWSTWYSNQALAFCQKLENSSFCRLSGTFAGPNQYGAYLVVTIPLLFANFLQKKRKIYLLITILGIVSLILTFSRSAWLGFFVELIIFGYLITSQSKYKKYFSIKKLAIAVSGFVVLFSLTVINLDNLKEKIIRPNSSSGHFEALKNGIEIAKNNPLGLGLGTSGPASYRFATEMNPAIITENWYLQIAIELGLLGAILFIIIIISILYENLNSPLALSFIGISLAALFLHSFEDSSTVLTLFTLLGLNSIKT